MSRAPLYAEARYMDRWAVVLWRVNNATGNRLWRFLPHRLRLRWAYEYLTAHEVWRAADPAKCKHPQRIGTIGRVCDHIPPPPPGLPND